MLDKLTRDSHYYLDPSAGKGDIAEAIIEANPWRRAHVDCIESNPELVDGVTLIVPDDTVQYRPEGTKEIAYENQAYRIGFDVVFKLIEWRGDATK